MGGLETVLLVKVVIGPELTAYPPKLHGQDSSLVDWNTNVSYFIRDTQEQVRAGQDVFLLCMHEALLCLATPALEDKAHLARPILPLATILLVRAALGAHRGGGGRRRGVLRSEWGLRGSWRWRGSSRALGIISQALGGPRGRREAHAGRHIGSYTCMLHRQI